MRDKYVNTALDVLASKIKSDIGHQPNFVLTEHTKLINDETGRTHCSRPMRYISMIDRRSMTLTTAQVLEQSKYHIPITCRAFAYLCRNLTASVTVSLDRVDSMIRSRWGVNDHKSPSPRHTAQVLLIASRRATTYTSPFKSPLFLSKLDNLLVNE